MSTIPPWIVAPKRLSYCRAEAHVWRLNLDKTSEEVEMLSRILSDDEILRAHRFVKEQDRKRYIVHRAGLRIILSRYLNENPRGVRILSDSRGKPHLKIGLPLEFSVSHSEGLALYSVCFDGSTGVDVERIRSDNVSSWIIDRFFFEEDASHVRRLRGDAYSAAYFWCWTRVEAYIKALGEGLGYIGEKVTYDHSCWSIYDLHPGLGYAGALAVSGGDHRIRCYDLEVDY